MGVGVLHRWGSIQISPGEGVVAQLTTCAAPTALPKLTVKVNGSSSTKRLFCSAAGTSPFRLAQSGHRPPQARACRRMRKRNPRCTCLHGNLVELLAGEVASSALRVIPLGKPARGGREALGTLCTWEGGLCAPPAGAAPYQVTGTGQPLVLFLPPTTFCMVSQDAGQSLPSRPGPRASRLSALAWES